MKKFKLLCLLGIIAFLPVIVGCASTYPIGVLYTKVNLPVTADAKVKSMKSGTVECKTVLSLVATGDVSYEAAMKKAGITKINHADWEAENILGIIGTYKLTVYGE